MTGSRRSTSVSVTASARAPAQYTRQDQSGDEQTIRIGDPDRTITGAHTYTIRYRLRGVLNHFKDHDELYLNVIGTECQRADRPGHRVGQRCRGPIDRRGLLRRPARIAGCPAPRPASRDRRRRSAQSTLAPVRRMTVVVGFPIGLGPDPEADHRAAAEPRAGRSPCAPTPSGIAGGLLAAVVAAGSAVLALRTGRDRRFVGSPTDVAFGNAGGAEERAPLRDGDPIPVEFVPPDRLRPGQVGTLIDEQANPLDVTATIIDLAVRGYLKITEIPKEGWLGNADWQLAAAQGRGEDLKPYEASCSPASSPTARRCGCRR